MNALTRRLTLLGHRVRRPWYERRLARVSLEEIDGFSFVVLPTVFNPVLLRTGAVLARHAGAWVDGAGRMLRILDMGTGSGASAVLVAARGARVVAVDLNPEAVRCARINAQLNRLEGAIDVRYGDLFAPVAGERFDLVTFNPPFFRGTPKDDADLAWRSPDVLERFAAELPEALAPGGTALLCLSTDGAGRELREDLARRGFLVEAVFAKDLGNEIVTLYAAERAR